MRARNIKPGFYINEELAECSIAARLLAPGLWMMADREGRLEDRPKRIKGEIYRYDSIDVESLLQELHDHHHIKRYTYNGHHYIQILRFKEHQAPHYLEKPSIIPSSSNDDASMMPPLISPDILNPDILNPDCSSNEEATPPQKIKNNYSEEFEDFWKSYPKNAASKAQASKSYLKALSTGAKSGEILAAIAAYCTYLHATETPVAHATTWLNQQRWTVDYASLKTADPPVKLRNFTDTAFDQKQAIQEVLKNVQSG